MSYGSDMVNGALLLVLVLRTILGMSRCVYLFSILSVELVRAIVIFVFSLSFPQQGTMLPLHIMFDYG